MEEEVKKRPDQWLAEEFPKMVVHGYEGWEVDDTPWLMPITLKDFFKRLTESHVDWVVGEL